MKTSRATASALLIAVSMQSSGTLAATLEDTITQTLADNPQAQASLNRYQASGEAVRAARGSYMPTVDLKAGVGHDKLKSTPADADAKTTDYKTTETSLILNQNLFDGLNTTNNYKKSREIQNSRKEQLKVKAELLALDVSDVYLKVIDNRKQVELAAENLKTHERIFDLVQRRASKGVANQSDFYQIEGRLARAQANLLVTQNSLQDAESQYMRIINQVPDDLSTPWLDNSLLPDNLDDAIKVAMKDHPSIASSAYEINASQFGYDGLRSKFLPSVDLSLSQHWDKDAQGIKGRTEDTRAMLTMRYNLFNGGTDMAHRQEAAYQVEESKANQVDTYRAVVESLRMAWASMKYVTEEQPYLKRHVEASTKTVAAYRHQFEIGKRSLLDVLDSENENYQSKRAYTSAQFRSLYARYRVLSSMGQMLNKLNIRMPSSWQG